MAEATVLWGPDHQELGPIATGEVGPSLAVALSRGRYPKGYHYVDPNEDAAMVAAAGDSRLAAVADGHTGFDAAAAAMQWLEAAAPDLLAEPVAGLEGAPASLTRAVNSATSALAGDRRRSATTLTLCVVQRRAGLVLNYGDSVAVLCGRRRAKVVSRETDFLGQRNAPGAPSLGSFTVRPGSLLVLCTDGVVDFLGRSWLRVVHDTVRRSSAPLTAAVALVERAHDGGSGDNAAVAVAAFPAES